MTATPTTDGFSNWLSLISTQMENALSTLIDKLSFPAQLTEVMRYATLNGGKRLRPAMVFAAANIENAPPRIAVAAACAVELIHCYSLVHDDLPCMDNDDIRRGKPSCHRAYGEATALLAGNSLHSLAFETLAAANLPAESVLHLARAAGAAGMCGGQMLDINGTSYDEQSLAAMCRLKTGALFDCALQLGLACQPQQHANDATRLTVFAEEFGLLFQLMNDINDTAQDTNANKKTYAILYPDVVKQRAKTAHDKALTILDGDFPRLADITRAVYL